MQTVLSKVKILDLSQDIAGAQCTKLLAGLGAEVLKIEKPGQGDLSRGVHAQSFHEGPNREDGSGFLYMNENKKSITLNLNSKTGKKILGELVKCSDIMVQSFEPKIADNLDISYKRFSKINPRLIMTSISPFGQTGPYRDWKASEITLEAMGGSMYQEGEYEQPVKFGLSPAQYVAGEIAAGATMTALFAAKTGEGGQHIDISLFECGLQMAFRAFEVYSYNGSIARRLPRGFPADMPVMEVKDGFVVSLIYGYVDMDLFARILDEPEIADPKFATYASRLQNIKEFSTILKRAFAKNTKDIFHTGQQVGLGLGVVQTIEDLVNCPQLAERNYFVSVEDPVVGRISYPGVPFKVDGSPRQGGRYAPLLGEHNNEIYCSRLGYTKKKLQELNSKGVI
jgi:crotonobetainyl-CoA:carnitine CoA-transferase CaiB-like acyl-CoA transferase